MAVLCIDLWQWVQMRDEPRRAEEPLVVLCIRLWQRGQMRDALTVQKRIWRYYV